jgi:membrane fusion protein (multidrug efflux system)
MPPTPVGVVTVQTASVGLTSELPGRLEALRTAQVRARVTGIVQKRLFTEGAKVSAHQALFQIDPAPYRAALDSALANQAKADAALALATATLERNRPLAEARAISQQEWVSSQAAQKQALADLAASKAAATQARLSLEYASVSSPISGRIGRANVTEGALVSATEATLLATVQQVDKLYVNITQPASEALRLKRDIQSGKLMAAKSAQVQLVLEDGSVYPHPAKLLFTDLSVDSGSGQVNLRAEVPNPDGDLLPGLYVRVRLPTAQSEDAMLVPQQAVTRGTSGDSVMVVGADHQVSQRQVQLGGANNGQWVVLSGLKVGEQVVVDGFQKIRPKAPVTPVPWTAPGAASAPAGESAPAQASAPASAASR